MSPLTSPSPIELHAGTVHLWYTSVAHTSIPFDDPLSVLDEEERDRAARFHFDRDQKLFVLGRAFLRCLLARYTGAHAAQIRFKQNQYGKLFLEYPVSPVQFNVAHSGDCIIHAIARGTGVGVDVETLRGFEAPETISSYFAPGEQAWLLATDPHEVNAGFFTLWTCKEAYIKALGLGLSKPLDSFEISLAKSREPKILFDSDDNTLPNSWRLLLFEPGPNVLGCVAVDIASKVVELRDYSSGVLLGRLF